MTKTKKGGLGKGLDALFVDNETADSGVMTLRISDIEPNRDQPRKVFNEEALQELADSIKEHGVLQPLLVRPLDSGTYQLVAGERRWRASRMAGLTELPVVIRDMDDKQAMEIALIENLQREDLNAIEEALGYRQLMERYEMTQEQISKRVGKSRSAVANAVRLLNLPQTILDMVGHGELSPGHARALLSFEDPEQAVELAHKIRMGRFSVRDIEKISREQLMAPKEAKTKNQIEYWGEGEEEKFLHEMEMALTSELGRKIRILKNGAGGTLQIQFFDDTDLKNISETLAGA